VAASSTGFLPALWLNNGCFLHLKGSNLENNCFSYYIDPVACWYMRTRKHLELTVYSFITWLSFYLIGLPDYYQQWPIWARLLILPLVTAVYFPITRYTLRKFWRDEKHLVNSCWLAFYLTLPLFIYDYLLLAVYRGLGIQFVVPYWYLTFFYFSFWVQFPYIAKKMDQIAVKNHAVYGRQ
jgi:hypothetical protein